jgi:hypothetical protein
MTQSRLFKKVDSSYFAAPRLVQAWQKPLPLLLENMDALLEVLIFQFEVGKPCLKQMLGCAMPSLRQRVSD